MGIVNCFKKTSIVIISSFTLFACGGGGGGDSEPDKSGNKIDGVQESKQLVQDVRNFVKASTIENDNLRIFTDEADLVKSIAEEQAKTPNKAITLTAKAMVDAFRAFETSEYAITEYLYKSEPSLLVSIEKHNDRATFRVNQDILLDNTVVQIDLSSSAAFSSSNDPISPANQDQPEIEQQEEASYVDTYLDIWGQASTQNSTIIIADSYVENYANCKWITENQDTENEFSYEICEGSLYLDLETKIETYDHKNQDNNSRFNGQLYLELENYKLYNNYSNLNIIGVEELHTGFEGRFENNAGESFWADADLSVEGDDDCFFYYIGLRYSYDITDNFGDTCDDGEKLSSNLKIKFSADLDGVSDDIYVYIDINSFQEKEIHASIDLTYNNKQIRFFYDKQDRAISISNQAGAELLIIWNDIDKTFEGNIYYADQVFADITSVNGSPKFTYSDGTIESL